jgi:hypothetical protein
MKLPKTIKIGGVDWGLDISAASGAQEDYFGQTLNVTTTIWARKDQSPSMLPSTILHEVIHAILLGAGIPQREHMVRALETGIAQVLRDNKWFADWLKNGRVG